MSIYVRFFLSLLNARSPGRDCNSAIIPRLRATYRTNLFANSYFCRTSGPHAGPIPQQTRISAALQDHTQDQFCSKFRAKRLLRATRRTSSAASSYLCRTSGPHAGPVLQHISCKTAAQNHTQVQFRSFFHAKSATRSTRRTSSPASSAQNKREPRYPRLPYCVLCNVS